MTTDSSNAKHGQEALRPVTVQKVAAVLRKAGFKASEYLSSCRVRGWGNSTEGVRSRTRCDGLVEVDYTCGTFGIVKDGPARRLTKLAECAKVLMAAGIAIQNTDEGTVHEGTILCLGLRVE